jgi:hypothetical protein
MNRRRTRDHAIQGPVLRHKSEGAAMMHFLNALCATVLIYATVTRGALGFARILERLVPSRNRG